MALFNGLQSVERNGENEFVAWCYFGHRVYDELCVDFHFDDSFNVVIDRMTATSNNHGCFEYSRYPKNVVADFANAVLEYFYKDK